jgi:murein DD-endopeptidase MepM/ murein hydrolase activator NlpD
MAADQEVKRNLFDRLQDSYRLVILDDEDLKEVGTYHFSLFSFYVLLSSFFLILGSFVVAFIVFTPVKRLIPGYGDINDNSKFRELAAKVKTLEDDIHAHKVYTEGLRNLLSGVNMADNDINPKDSLKAKQIIKNSDIQEGKITKELDNLHFSPPIKGQISADFNPAISHYGMDIIAPKGTEIKSIADGIIINAEWSADSGNSVYIQHPRNVISVYKHNSVLLVKTGHKVKTGQAIAIIGNTGTLTDGPHLHLELWYDGNVVNPKNYIAFN